ncbi:hypothetical protein TRFO_31483 [Tritrichomonas foetus]|uniref:Uncharacterized protein n=1 Tax=Tritrichomonas foetus TaxID=1144522 RepID=A0A1J4JSA8_9EUKA|nr:hypothetical protein TRFO_31483 [Tritrichomonas foetus]|eukprot:OHT01650.1 hypothetical protein TRFO_31483 [Tritrichomonas foetus]
MIPEHEQLFKIDETAVHRYMNNIGNHLKTHDEQIAELMKLLRGIPSANDINQLRDEFDRKLNQLKESLNNKIEDSNQSLNDRISRLKDDTDNKLSSISESLGKKIDNVQNDLSGRLSDVEEEIEKLKKHISTLPTHSNDDELNEALNNIKKLNDLANENREYIQTIATSYALVNKTQAPLGPALQRTLYATSDYITRNFKKLSDAIKALQGIKPTSETIIQQTEIDLSGLNYIGSEIPADFNESPKLPPIYKFGEVPDAIQYMYDSFPKLQGYLNALHKRLLTVNDGEKGSDFDPSVFDNLIATVRKALADMAAELNELKKGNGNKGLTRADVLKMLRDLLAEEDFDGNDTAIGYVKCIACGREIRQVAGAMTEEMAYRTLGAPTNSVAMFPYIGADKSINQMFANSDQVDKSYLESPRSKRKRMNTRKFKPHPPA